MIGALSIFGVIILAIVALALIVQLVKVLVRLAFALVLAIMVGALAGSWAASQDDLDGVLSGILAASISFVPAVLLVWHWLGPVGGPPATMADRVSPTTSHDGSVPNRSPADPSLALAWQRAERLAPRAANRIRAARLTCEQLLQSQERFEGEWLEVRLLINRHVAPLVSDTDRACTGADRSERARLIANLTVRLEAIGNRAAELLEAERMQAKDSLAVRDLHVTNLLGTQSELGIITSAARSERPAMSWPLRFGSWLRRASDGKG